MIPEKSIDTYRFLKVSISIATFPITSKVSPQDFLPILCAPQPKIMNRSFWPACDQNLGLVSLRCDHESNFRNFYLERLRTFTPMVPKVSLQNFLPLFGVPRSEIMNRSFWPLCDQMMLLAGVRLKSMFGLFDRCAIRKGLKTLRLMAGFKFSQNSRKSFHTIFFKISENYLSLQVLWKIYRVFLKTLHRSPICKITWKFP